MAEDAEQNRMSVSDLASRFNEKTTIPADERVSKTKTTRPDIRILLAGRTGHGKSATANSLLGEKKFKASENNTSVTRKCQWERTKKDGILIEIVDTPGFFDTKFSEQEIDRELYRALMLSSPGFNAILFVIQKGRFTDELKKLVDRFFVFFGGDVHKFSIPVFTHVDRQSTLKQFLGLAEDSDSDEDDDDDDLDVCAEPNLKDEIKREKIDDKLYDLITKCHGNIMIIDNKAKKTKREKQVRAIFSEIERIRQSTKHGYFRNTNFQIVDEMIKRERQNPNKDKKGWDWVPNVVKRWLNPSKDNESQVAEGGKPTTNKIISTEIKGGVLCDKESNSAKRPKTPPAQKERTERPGNSSNQHLNEGLKKAQMSSSPKSIDDKGCRETVSHSTDDGMRHNSASPSCTHCKCSQQPVNITLNVQQPYEPAPVIPNTIEEKLAKEDDAGSDIKEEELLRFKEKVQKGDSFVDSAVNIVKSVATKVVSAGIDIVAAPIKSAWTAITSWF